MVNKLAKVVRGKQKPVPVKIVGDSSRPTPMDSDMKWRAESALRTLSEAEKIRSDKALMKAVKAEATAQLKQLSAVCKK